MKIFKLEAGQWRFRDKVYAIVMVVLFGASFFAKEKKQEESHGQV